MQWLREPTRQAQERLNQQIEQNLSGNRNIRLKTRQAGVLEMLRIENESDSRLNMGHQAAILRPFQIGTLFEFRRLLAHGNEEDG